MKTPMALFTKYKKLTFMKSWDLLRRSRFLLLVVGIALFAVWPLFHPGLIPTHDGEYHLIRFYEFNKMLLSGYWYPRWAPDLDFGFGLPLFSYVYPLPNYVASFLHVFGVSFLEGVKQNMVIATITGAVLFYLWAKRFWGSVGAVVSSVFYTFAPYHFIDIYVRGSVGEVWALGLFPGFLWTYTEFVYTKKWMYGLFAAIFLALTIFSHNIVGLMFFMFAASYMFLFIVMSKSKRTILLYSFCIVLLSLGISSIFWLPALLETQFVTGLQVYNIAQNFPDLFQLLFPSWGTGFFDTNLTNQMSVQIGTANLFVIFLSIFLLLFWKKQKEKVLIGFFLGCFVIVFLLMLPLSISVWQYAPLIHYFQFPWRLLSLVILICAFLAGGVIDFKKPKLFALLLILFVIATTYTYTQPAYYMQRNDLYYVSRSNFIDSTNSPGNSFNTIWNTPQTRRPIQILVPQENGEYPEIKKISATKFITQITNTKSIQQVVNVSYFPGWQITLDGKHITGYPNQQGLLAFRVPAGQHTIHIAFLETPLETFAALISIATVFIPFILFYLPKKISKLSRYLWEN